MALKTTIVCSLLFCFLISSCVVSRKAIYFDGQKDEEIIATSALPPSVIQSNDLLSISVSSLNPEATAIFNSPNTALTPISTIPNSGAIVQTTGYLVNAEGNVQFPILGSLKAAGYTTNQLGDQLTKTLVSKKLLVDPIVTIRYLNFRVTVLGEVSRPAVVNVPGEKISLLEALGLAGDITVFGKKDNVLVIREVEGKKIIKRVNLNTSEIFQSPYYYLRSNDIVYVEPNKAKLASSTRSTQFLPILLSGLSFAAIIIDRLTR